MALQVVWTQSALSDLEQIVCYVAADDLEAARRFGTSLIQRVEQVASLPRSGRVVPEINEDAVREIILTPYRIVYEIFNDTQSLHVLRVWHAARTCGNKQVRIPVRPALWSRPTVSSGSG